MRDNHARAAARSKSGLLAHPTRPTSRDLVRPARESAVHVVAGNPTIPAVSWRRLVSGWIYLVHVCTGFVGGEFDAFDFSNPFLLPAGPPHIARQVDDSSRPVRDGGNPSRVVPPPIFGARNLLWGSLAKPTPGFMQLIHHGALVSTCEGTTDYFGLHRITHQTSDHGFLF